MSNEETTKSDAVAATNSWNTSIIEEFRANEGRVGGPFEGAPVLLLHTIGAKSGQTRVNPMMYLREGDRLFVFASKAGADTHPDWYHNLIAKPAVSVEIGTETLSGTASPLGEDERRRVYAIQAERFPGFAEYEKKTTRVISVVELFLA